MSEEAKLIIGMMGTAIAAMFSFMVWLFKQTISRDSKRIERLEEREEKTIQALAESIKPIPAMMQTLVETVREMRLALGYTSRDRSHWRPQDEGGDR